jgi:hypothetical protein
LTITVKTPYGYRRHVVFSNNGFSTIDEDLAKGVLSHGWYGKKFWASEGLPTEHSQTFFVMPKEKRQPTIMIDLTKMPKPKVGIGAATSSMKQGVEKVNDIQETTSVGAE